MPDLSSLDWVTLEGLLEDEPVDQDLVLDEIHEFVLSHRGALTAIADLDRLIEQSLTPQATELRDRWNAAREEMPQSEPKGHAMVQFQALLSDVAYGLRVPSGPGLQPWSMQQWFQVLADCLHGLDRNWIVLERSIASSGNPWGDVVDVTREFVRKLVDPTLDFISAHRKEIDAFLRPGAAA